jgi:hypothetical protein
MSRASTLKKLSGAAGVGTAVYVGTQDESPKQMAPIMYVKAYNAIMPTVRRLIEY